MKYLSSVIFFVVLFSCDRKEDTSRDYIFHFYPRIVNYLWSDYSALVHTVEFEGKVTYSIEDFTGETLKSDLFLLGLYTSNVVYDTIQIEKALRENYFDGNGYIAQWPPVLTHYEPIRLLQDYMFENNFTDAADAGMEQKIDDSYTRIANANSSGNSQWTPPPISQDYRLTEIRNLTITCNVALFGAPAGSSLNGYFHIADLDPCCVFYGNKQLAMDNIQTSKEIKAGFSIEKWLSFRPISATWFHFKLTATPPELPVNDVVFTITMETAAGDILECKSKPITLTR